MKGDIREYARLGLVHHMVYPRSVEDPDEHARTLIDLLGRGDIETLDCCVPYGEERRRRVAAAARASGKQALAFSNFLFPLRKLSFTSPAYYEQAQIRMLVSDYVQQAAALGATGFVFASGGPTPAEATEAHYRAFADFCRWLCAELRPHGITAQLEPFDMTVDKKFLYGPTRQCVALIESMQPDVDNFGIELDVAHLPLMGEDAEEAIRVVAPHLKRVHLGNCVLRDPSHPLYGDKHPPIGYPGGEIDTPETARILRRLLEIGYLSKEKRGDLVIEATPWPGRTVEESLADGFARVENAWALV
ncbi:MAG: sugar phosphate isomerase/epimerase [Candidatus Sumerlaeota bacterium]|nr:sugar phosphate isomerase/epimerase [Candidatus Sumerlaeota bacterium]